MALNIKNAEADRLARELVALTGETITDVIVSALEDRLRRERALRRSGGLRAEVERIQERLARLPELDKRSLEDIIDYNDSGLPR